jgi:hypothetical protein
MDAPPHRSQLVGRRIHAWPTLQIPMPLVLVYLHWLSKRKLFIIDFIKVIVVYK